MPSSKKPTKPFYKRKRLWVPLILLALVSLPFIINPLKSFYFTVNQALKIFGIEQKTLRVGRVPLHFYEGGNPEAPPVILLHGFGGNALFTWMQLMPALAKSHHVIAPDLLASNLLHLNPKFYSVDTEVRLVMLLMDALEIKQADLVGLSVGGWVSLLIASEHPERVNRLVLIESAGLTMPLPELATLVLNDREKARRFLNLLFHKPPPLPDFVLDALVKNAQPLKNKYQLIFQSFIKNSKERVLDDKLSQITQPTLIIHGRQDQVVPLEVGKRLHQGLPNSTLIILEESGHGAVWDSPHKLKKEVAGFLRD